MRVCFVVNNYPPRTGGVELHVGHLARRLAGDGHEVDVHTLTTEDPGTTVEDGVVVHRYREWFSIGGILGLPTPRSLVGLLGVGRGADAISVHTRFFPLTWIGVVAGRLRGVPVLHTEHGSGFVVSDSAVTRWGARLVDLTLGRLSLRAASRVVGVSDEVVAFVLRLAGVHAQVFHNAIEPPEGVEDFHAPRRHLVFVGRLVPGKGWAEFLDAVAVLPDDVTAEVLGDGPDLDSVRDAVAGLGLAERVAVRGRVPLDEVFDRLRGAILVNPTRLAEGFQTTLLEALAVGARVVTHPVPGAALLAAQGAPVRVVARSPRALADGVAEELETPSQAWDAEGVRPWTWAERSQEFVELARGLGRAQRRP